MFPVLQGGLQTTEPLEKSQSIFLLLNAAYRDNRDRENSKIPSSLDKGKWNSPCLLQQGRDPLFPTLKGLSWKGQSRLTLLGDRRRMRAQQ